MEEKIAIHCPTKDDWDKVQEKVTGENPYVGWVESANCICPFGEGFAFESKNFYEEQNYTIIPAEEWLAGLKVGDRVEVVSKGSVMYQEEGEIKSILTNEDYKYAIAIIGEPCWYSFKAKDLKLIESEDSMKECKCDRPICAICNPTYSVPLREGDKVRVVLNRKSWEKGSTRIGDIGVIVEASTSIGKGWYVEMNRDIDSDCRACRVKPNNSHIGLLDKTELELIPTEKDIVVGSVWEFTAKDNFRAGQFHTIESLDNHTISGVATSCSTGGSCFYFSQILRDCKLIHRGDKEMEENFKGYTEFKAGDAFRVTVQDSTTLNIKPNKKEKKMKREEMEIKRNMPIFDEECGNTGKVVGIFKASDQASYLDDADGKVRTVSMSQLHYKAKLILPKPKPVKKVVKKKKKKTTKKKK